MGVIYWLVRLGICTGSEEYKKVAFGFFFFLSIFYLHVFTCTLHRPDADDVAPDAIGEPRILKIRNRTEPPPRPSFLGTRS